MLLALLGSTLAAPSLTVRMECDAAGGLPTAKDPLVVSVTPAKSAKAVGQIPLGKLEETTANARFAVTFVDRVQDVRVLEVVAWSADGKVLGDALFDVDLASGEVIAGEGEGIALRYRGEQVRAGGDEDGHTFRVALQDEVAVGAAMVTLTDLTGDGAIVGGDAFDQALALGALSTAGRTNFGGFTFDDAHPIDTSRQVWSGSLPVETSWAGEATLTVAANRCLPDGVYAPADGTLAYTEALVLMGSARSPKWKSVTLGLREPETEVWAWPFVARVKDPSAEGVYVTLTPLDGAVKPRSTTAWVRVPARERLSDAREVTRDDTVGTEVIEVSVQPAYAKDPPATVTTVRYDGRIRFEDRGGAAIVAPEVVATWSSVGAVPSVVRVEGPGDEEWDGTVDVSVRGPAVWDDLVATVTVSNGETGKVVSTVTFPLTTLTSVFEGEFVFDASFDGGTYRWDCVGCGDDFTAFERTAWLGTGTRTSSSQANNKAELL